MSLLNQNKKGKKKDSQKANSKGGTNSKFIQKPQNTAGFVNKQQNTGSQRGS